MKIHQLTAKHALASLQSGLNGLTRNEARRRLHEYGPNRVEAVAREHMLFRLMKEFTHFFALILWFAAVLAFVAEWKNPGQGMATLGYAILAVIFINGLFSFWQEYRAEQALAALRKLLPHKVKVVREGVILESFAETLVPGDLLLLAQGDNVPADCRLIESFGLRVNNATITGESLPRARETDPSKEERLLDSRNVAFAGTSVVSGEAKAVVFATAMHTEFGKIAHLAQSEKETASPLQQEIARMSRLVTFLATLLGILFFLIGQWIGLSFWENFIFAIGIIVANVPEGLLPTVTLSLAMATQRMAKRNALIRHLPAVEALGAATVIVTDKTGTLTENRMAVRQIFLDGQLIGPEDLKTASPKMPATKAFLEVARLCHNLQQIEKNGAPILVGDPALAGDPILAGDPMEIALVHMSIEITGEPFTVSRLDEIPFDSDRKRLTTIHMIPDGKMLYCKGAPETVLPLCTYHMSGAERLPLTDEVRKRIAEAQNDMAQQGLRVLAFASRNIPATYSLETVEQELTLLGLVGLEDPPRPEVKSAIQKCRDASIKVIMVTGDNPVTARAIAQEIGLVQSPDPIIMTGPEIARLSNTQLQLALDAPEIIFARVSADQKMLIVNALRRKKEIVAVTGDGVNDAPALKAADIGIAMGIAGTDVAKESADMILLDDNFASIVSAIEEGRAVFDNIRKFLTYILTSNIPEIVPYLAFVLFRIPLPLTVIQILAVDLGTDLVPALALGSEKPHPGIMQRPPRQRTERLLNWRLMWRAYLFLGLFEALASLGGYFFILENAGWRYGQSLAPTDPVYLQATTACLSAIIVMQVANVFLCRSAVRSIGETGLGGNPLLYWGIMIEITLILVVDYTPFGQRVFGTAPIPLDAWLFTIPFALVMVGFEEARKYFSRHARI